tara:strand:- start:2823 stop:3998 length:1176 start_codon:yes stop_codon:yes gene_type:complete
MKSYTKILADGQSIQYVDKKRWLWMLSVVFPLQPFLPIILHARTNIEIWFVFPFLINYMLVPLLDYILGVDSNNPHEEIVQQLEQDAYYRRLTYAVVPMHYISLFGAAWYGATASLSWWAFALLALNAGLISGLAINTGHELGHKNTKIEKLLARLALAVPAYGHFSIDHNRGHHMLVATPEDHASSRMGESIYKFALREIPGAFLSAWKIEKNRLTNRNVSVWSLNNHILQSYALTVTFSVLLSLFFGWSALIFLVIHNVFAYWQLTSANYIEHYGLLRKKSSDGKYEKCQPYHSWNSNHILSNLILFHLERHSDHHSHPLRRFQSLRHFANLPQLPNGYFGMYLLAYCPKLWFKVMNKKLLALPHVEGDIKNLNIDYKAYPSICKKWGS